MDVFKLLKQDHKLAKNLFKQLQSKTEQAPKKREKAFQQLMEELTLHTEVEEKIVYPRLREEKKLHDTILEAYEEHGLAKRLLQELSEMSMEDERWNAKLSVLKEMIEHHVEEEEDEVFTKAAKAIDKKEAKELGQQVEAAKKEMKREGKNGGASRAMQEQPEARP